MLTKMTDADWAIVLQVFGAVRSRRGDKGRDGGSFVALACAFILIKSVHTA